MLELYGRQWESSYGHVDGDVFPVWCDALASLKPENIKAGLEALISEGGEYPPNLVKFLRLCRQSIYVTMSPMQTALPPPGIHKEQKVIDAKEQHLLAVKELLK